MNASEISIIYSLIGPFPGVGVGEVLRDLNTMGVVSQVKIQAILLLCRLDDEDHHNLC